MFGNESIRKPPLTLFICSFISLSPQYLTRSIHPTLQLKAMVCLINHWILMWENKRTRTKTSSIRSKKSEQEMNSVAWGHLPHPLAWEEPFPKSTLSPNHQFLGWLHHSVKQHVRPLLATGYWISMSLISYKKSCSLETIVDYIFLRCSINASKIHSTVPKGLQAQGTCARSPARDWSGETNDVYLWLE